MELFNKESYGDEELRVAFEQYKLYVEMADKVSERRGQANTFFTTVNTLLFTAFTFLATQKTVWYVLLGAIGCVISFAWFFTLNSYRQLNSGKFKVINEIEKVLPLSGFSYEWEVLEKGKSKTRYWKLSSVERVVPVIFFISYIATALLHIFLA